MRTIAILACSASKLEHPAPAAELYRGALFRKGAELARRRGHQVVILSALHGLVMPEQEIAPYDVTLGAMRKAEAEAWASRAAEELLRFAAEIGPCRIVCFAGERYRRALELAGLAFEAPLRGMGIGVQLGALTRELAATPK